MICKGMLKSLNLDWKTRKPEITLRVDARPEDVERLRETVLSVELKKYRKKRSLDANAYYWKLVGELAGVIDQSNSWIHNDMLRRFGQIEIIDGHGVYIVIPDTDDAQKKVDEAQSYHLKPTDDVNEGKDGVMYRTYMMLRGSSSYDTKEMSRLINGLVSDCQEHGIETIPPEELERMMQAYGKKHNAK